jgi:microcystin-dependent protein
MSDPFIAEIRIFAGNFAPRSWAFCNGQLLPIAQNTALFSLVGTTYGGDGRTNFGLPNLQGRAPMHPGNGPGLSSRRLGQSGGADTVTLSESLMPAHRHTVQVSDEDGADNSPADMGTSGTEANQRIYGAVTNLTAMAQVAMPDNAGGSQQHNNLQPFLVLNFIIALAGVFPSRN